MLEPHKQRHSGSYQFIFWAAAILIITLGGYLSTIQFLSSEWLSRAGCIVVMLGIWSGIGGVIQERILYRRTKWRRRKALAFAKARLVEDKAEADLVEQELAKIGETFDTQMSEAAQNIRLSIGVLEVSLLMTGTFLWGFGDIIMRYSLGA